MSSIEKTCYRAETSGQRNKSVVKSRYEPTKLQVVCKNDTNADSANKEEEWSTSKKVVNHKTRQVETRVQRQIIMEDGKVIADSGPQITTRTKEDHKTEESENSNKKSKGDRSTRLEDFEAGDQVISEKIETHNTTREAKQENLQYHDESIKELTGYEIHKKALVAPNDLLSIDDNQIDSQKPRGKLTHYSSKSQKVTDKEEIKEVSRRDRNGKMTSEVTRTHQHEEVDDDEIPEDQAGTEALPEASAETTRKIEYHKNYDDEKESQRNGHKLAVEGSHETNAWVESHFGSETGSYESRSKTRAGGNKINIELMSNQRPSSRHRNDSSANRERNVQKEEMYRSDYSKKETSKQSPIRSTVDCYIEEVNRSPSPAKSFQSYSRHEVDSYQRDGKSMKDERSEKYESRSMQQASKSRVFREDASVQASLSDESSDEEEVHARTGSKNGYYSHRYHETHESRSHQKERPMRTFYFGENEHNSSSNIKQAEKPSEKRYTTRLTLEKDKEGHIFNYSDDDEKEFYFGSQNMDDNEGELKATFKHDFKSSVNDQIINDSVMNETFHRSYHTPGDKLEAQRSFDRLMDKSFPEHFQSGEFSSRWKRDTSSQDLMSRERENINVPVFIEDNKMEYRKNAENRQRSDFSKSTLPPLSKRNTNPIPDLIKADSRDKYSYLPSYTSSHREHHGSGTWTKSKNKNFSSRKGEEDREWPEFSPLSSPLQIINMSSDHSRKNSYSSYRS